MELCTTPLAAAVRSHYSGPFLFAGANQLRRQGGLVLSCISLAVSDSD